MFCAKCGAKIEDDAVFCSKCGARQGVAAQEETPVQAPVAAPAANPTGNAELNTPAQPDNIEAPKKKKKTGLLIGLIIGGAVLGVLAVLAVIIMLIVVATSCSGKPENNTEPGTTASAIAVVPGDDDDGGNNSISGGNSSNTLKPSITKEMPYTLSELSEAICADANYYNIGGVCSYDDAEVSDEVYAHLSPEQAQYYTTLKRCTCCHSVSAAREHIRKYMADRYLQDFSEENFLEYGGSLYYVITPHGGFGYQSDITDANVSRQDSYTLHVSVTGMGEGDMWNTVFVFKYMDGRYKIADTISTY